MNTYRQVLDFDSECEYCHEPLILLTNDDPASPTFHMCTCQYPRPHIIEDGVGAIPSFARSNVSDIINAFATLWNSINKDRGFGWEVNPWVWVIEFQCWLK